MGQNWREKRVNFQRESSSVQVFEVPEGYEAVGIEKFVYNLDNKVDYVSEGNWSTNIGGPKADGFGDFLSNKSKNQGTIDGVGFDYPITFTLNNTFNCSDIKKNDRNSTVAVHFYFNDTDDNCTWCVWISDGITKCNHTQGQILGHIVDAGPDQIVDDQLTLNLLFEDGFIKKDCKHHTDNTNGRDFSEGSGGFIWMFGQFIKSIKSGGPDGSPGPDGSIGCYESTCHSGSSGSESHGFKFGQFIRWLVMGGIGRGSTGGPPSDSGYNDGTYTESGTVESADSGCSCDETDAGGDSTQGGCSGGGMGGSGSSPHGGGPGGFPGSSGPPDVGHTETAGNCLSFPVIWAEGVNKTLRGTPGMDPILNGVWWYSWGTGAEGNPLSCLPDPDNEAICADKTEPGPGWHKVYQQQDENNTWQAGSADWSSSPVNVDWIDWGDNLESVDWYSNSKVRTEVVLTQDLDTPMLQYKMDHLYGRGMDELWGVNTTGGIAKIVESNTQATVYSPCARLTIQKLLVDRENLTSDDLRWVPEVGWTENDSSENLINESIYSMAVYEAEDGPGYYSAEINVKGKIIYGYTWDVGGLNDMAPTVTSSSPTPAGDYRITFSLDSTCGGPTLNTFFTEGVTNISMSQEEETEEPGSHTGGAVPKIDFENNLTYIDVRILDGRVHGGDMGGPVDCTHGACSGGIMGSTHEGGSGGCPDSSGPGGTGGGSGGSTHGGCSESGIDGSDGCTDTATADGFTDTGTEGGCTDTGTEGGCTDTGTEGGCSDTGTEGGCSDCGSTGGSTGGNTGSSTGGSPHGEISAGKKGSSGCSSGEGCKPHDHPVTIEWGDGNFSSTVAASPLRISHIYAEGNYTLNVTVTDEYGRDWTDSKNVTVKNIAPSICSINLPIDPVLIGTNITASARFTDPGVLDNHTAIWDWGDNNVSNGTVDQVNHTVNDTYLYNTPGIYTVNLTVDDGDGGVGTKESSQYVVIYDPSGGFVTGGGWLDSPDGAYAADPDLMGKAIFGFVSKYKKGAEVPVGHTEFQFKVADLNFHSDNYQWLVIAGPKAKYKGIGTINGEGSYGFMISAVDGELTPSTDSDLFRIKIWDMDNGDAVVYDNQMGNDDDADPITAIKGGSIKIHEDEQ